MPTDAPGPSDGPTPDEALRPGAFVDSDHPRVRAWAAGAVGDAAGDARAAAVRLFDAVRDGIRYDPYTISRDPADYRASQLVDARRAFCVPKAVLFVAGARAAGIPARLGFADVKNHLASPKLLERLGTDLFAFHGFGELWLDGRWVRATPTFDDVLCARLGVPPLDFDGTRDALFQPFDREGRAFMDYVRYRGTFQDLPFDEMRRVFDALYGGGARDDAPAGDTTFR